tara:strand:- start:6773 stop:8026 length:1254 start_codon:yes stop_codon:yes gene_type:complete
MMIGKITPVSLPFDPTEDRLIRSRQNKLARDIDIIRQKIRNNILSASEGNMRIQFKKAEIDQLQRYRGSKRNPTGRLSPSPKSPGLFRTKKSRKPAKKYNATDSDRVGRGTEPTGMFKVDDITYNRANPEVRSTTWAEDDRAGMTSKNNQRSGGRKPPVVNDKSDLNQRGLSPNNYYSRYVENYERRVGKKPSSRIRDAMKKDAERLWNANAALPKLVPYKAPKETLESKAKDAISEAKDKGEKALDKVKDFFSRGKSSRKSSSEVDQSKNPYAKAYGPTFGRSDRSKTKGYYVIYKGQFYGPKNSFSIPLFLAWNEQKGVTVKRQTKKTIRVSDFAGFDGFAGMPNFLIQQQARARRDTALMRKRMGSRLKIDNPNMTTLHRSQDSPRQVMRPNEPVSNLAGGLTKTRNSMQRLLK